MLTTLIGGFDFMYCLKKYTALAMFYAGESKTLIRKTLNVKVKRLKKWITEDRKSSKEEVLHMYFFGYSRKKICSTYYLSKHTLDLWILEAYDDIKSHTQEKTIIRQAGRSQWTSNILKK